MTRIGIIGNGNVGSALEKGIGRTGNEARAVGHEPDKVKQVAGWAEAVVLAVPYDQREDALQTMGDTIEGKTVVDVTNAVGKDGFMGSTKQSGAEELQKNHPNARFVKAFNTVFAQNMSRGTANGEPLSLFVAGDDQQARHQVLELGKQLGFDPVDSGPLQNARWLETLGYLNMQLGFEQENGTDSGFRYVHPGVRTKQEMAAQASR